jgi:hypothetical protein
VFAVIGFQAQATADESCIETEFRRVIASERYKQVPKRQNVNVLANADRELCEIAQELALRYG